MNLNVPPSHADNSANPLKDLGYMIDRKSLRWKHNPTQMKILHQAFMCFELLDIMLQLEHLFVLAYVHYFLFVISSYAISLFVCFAINVFNVINLTFMTFSLQRVQSLKKKFYFHFQDYVDLVIWKVRLALFFFKM